MLHILIFNTNSYNWLTWKHIYKTLSTVVQNSNIWGLFHYRALLTTVGCLISIVPAVIMAVTDLTLVYTASITTPKLAVVWWLWSTLLCIFVGMIITVRKSIAQLRVVDAIKMVCTFEFSWSTSPCCFNTKKTDQCMIINTLYNAFKIQLIYMYF